MCKRQNTNKIMSLQAAGLREPVDDAVVDHIRELTRRGVRKASEMMRQIRYFVENNLGITAPSDQTRRRYQPLYFLCVKTNVGYTVVGAFVTESETQKAVQEALEVFRDWNDKWTPSFFMTDFASFRLESVVVRFPS